VLTRFSSVAGMGKKEQRPAICESRKCALIRQASLFGGPRLCRTRGKRGCT
jgi:hypothetical protein